jgi:hypothetical protein
LAFSDSEFNKQQTVLLEKFKNLFQTNTESGIENFFEIAIVDLIVIAEDITIFVLGLIKDILIEIMNLVGQSIATVQEILNYPIEIPIISWLYQEISDHPLTILDVVSLIFALPITIIYKVINGGPQANPPLTNDASRTDILQVSSIINKPLPWPTSYLENAPKAAAIRGAAVTSPKLGEEEGDDKSLKTILGYAMLFNAMVMVGADMGSDVEDSAQNNGLPTEGLGMLTSLLILFSEIVEMGLGTPTSVIAKPYSSRSLADHAYIAKWASSSVSIALDVTAVVASKKGEVMKFEKWGPWVEMITGLLELGVGIFATVEYAKDPKKEYSAAASVEAILDPIPSMLKPLVLVKGDAVVVTLPTLMLIDFIGGMGSAVCSFLEEEEIV